MDIIHIIYCELACLVVHSNVNECHSALDHRFRFRMEVVLLVA
jgi:hypothetical protein